MKGESGRWISGWEEIETSETQGWGIYQGWDRAGRLGKGMAENGKSIWE